MRGRNPPKISLDIILDSPPCCIIVDPGELMPKGKEEQALEDAMAGY